jgi:hypothetical protein
MLSSTVSCIHCGVVSVVERDVTMEWMERCPLASHVTDAGKVHVASRTDMERHYLVLMMSLYTSLE